jgi:hypothetical protein
MTENLAQSPTNTIAHNRATDFPRRDEAGPRLFSTTAREHGKGKDATARHYTQLADALKFCRLGKPARSWKAKIPRHANMLRRSFSAGNNEGSTGLQPARPAELYSADCYDAALSASRHTGQNVRPPYRAEPCLPNAHDPHRIRQYPMIVAKSRQPTKLNPASIAQTFVGFASQI